MEFNEFVVTLMKLQSTTKTTVKEQLLSSIKDNEVAKDFFHKCLDPKFQFGCKRLPDYTGNDPDRPSSYHFVEIAYTRLLEDKKGIQGFIDGVLNTLTKYEYDLFVRICKKDPACGVSVALVNRVWPGLIDTGIKLCKAEPYSKKAMEHISFPCYVQRKEDGARCLCFVEPNGEVRLFSSAGKEYQGLEPLVNEIKDGAKKFFENTNVPTGIILDGELLAVDPHIGCLPRKAGNGLLTKSIRGTISQKEADMIVFVIWDCISYEEYYCNIPSNKKEKYIDRYENTKLFASKCPLKVITVKTKQALTVKDVYEQFKEELENGKEGIIVKNLEFLWDGKRIKDQVKFKLDLDVTLKVIGWRRGAKGTKYESMLGALICTSSDNKVVVSVGSGFSDPFRKEFAEAHSEKLTENMYVEVRSNGLIQHGNEYSLFLPRFIEVRNDKTEADSYEMIKALQDAAFELK